MIRLRYAVHDDRDIPLISDEAYRSTANTFTVIVGKNGLGKSRLLSSIARSCISEVDDYGDGHLYRSHQDEPVVIAASTSPFDKFPLPPRRRGASAKNYRYVGMRGEGMSAASSSIALFSSVTRGLLSKLLFKAHRADLVGVFRALSFSPSFEFVLKPLFSSTNKPRTKVVRAFEGRRDYYIEERFGSLFSRMSTGERSNVEYAIDNVGGLLEKRRAFSLRIDFDSGRSYFDDRLIVASQINSILTLMEVGLVRLMDIRTAKSGLGEISLRAASSGEQCVLVLILGIASYIEDGSLILIDEPEISLHPEWQEEFMGLLSSSFEHYSRCQFVIATHSPQITARLKEHNSFVCSLGSGQLMRASEFSNKSADYQLAELFDSPGRMNEYISRVSFNLIAQIRSGNASDPETSSGMAKLAELKAKIDRDDRMKDLIESVQELYRQYV